MNVRRGLDDVFARLPWIEYGPNSRTEPARMVAGVAAGDEEERGVVLADVVERRERLNVAATAVDVRPLGHAVAPVRAVLMPGEGDPVTRQLEVRLVDQLVHGARAQQLPRHFKKARVAS